jgi:predicted anti-sigma-YlaC factor YlaD
MGALRPECATTRKRIIELKLGESENTAFAFENEQHLKVCSECRLYVQALGRVRTFLPETGNYTADLRRRSLARVRQRTEGWNPQKTLLLLMASLASVPFSFLLPVWMLSWLMQNWMTSRSVSLGLSFVMFITLGSLTVGISSFLLLQRRKVTSDAGTDRLQEEYHG